MPVYQAPLIDQFNRMGAQKQQAFENQRQLTRDDLWAAQQERQNQLADKQMRLSDLAYNDEMEKRAYKAQERDYIASQPPPEPPSSLYAMAPKSVQEFVKAEAGPGSDIQPPQEAKHPLRLQLEFAQQQGNTDKLNELHGMALKRAVEMSALTGKGEAAAQEYNNLTGANIQYIGGTKEGIKLGIGDKYYLLNPATQKMELIAEGGEKQERDKPTGNVVRDASSPTGYSYLTEQQNRIPGAPDPTKKKEGSGDGSGGGDVSQSTFVDPTTGKPLVFDKKTGSYRVANIDGGVAPKPNALSPEAATRAQQLDTVLGNIPVIRGLVFDENGKVDRGDLANATIGTPFTKGREIKQTVKRTIEQTLRIATGAAAPDSEVASYMKMYSPQMGDTDEQIAKKIDALEAFAAGAKAKYNIGRGAEAVAAQQPQRPEATPAVIPAGAISMLKKDRSLAAAFDAKYGAGSAAKVLRGR